ncbi:hypothetical protein M8J77_002971 [Diaphorina citri]|nr:hypothetical protein M8J77_002971 [Diaphorina citri]
MDISAFSSDNFDVKNWINESLKNVKDQDNKSVYVGNMVKKLQLYVQQVNSGLEEMNEQVVASLPRIMRDANVLSQEAEMLQQKMSAVKQEIIDVEKNTRASMASLERIDKIKSELLSAKQSLHEADNWTLMTTDIEEIFERGDIEGIAAKIVSMQQCLAVLTHTPDYEDKRLQLETLKNQLEAIASPHLVQAFTSKHLDDAHKFVRIFSSMERLPQLLSYYDKCQKGVYCEEFKRVVERGEELSGDTLVKQVYEFLLSEGQNQLKWCTQLLPNSIGVTSLLTDLYIDVLESLNPGIGNIISSALKEQVEPIPLLLDIQKLTFKFDSDLHAMVLNQKESDLIQPPSRLRTLIHAPLSPHLSNYSNLQYNSMLAQLHKQEDVTREDVMDQVDGLAHSTDVVFKIMTEAITTCFQLSRGCVVTQLIDSCHKFLTDYLHRFASISKQISSQHNDAQVDAWHLFPLCLGFLQAQGDLLHRMCVWSTLVGERVNETRGNAVTEYVQLYLNRDETRAFNSFLLMVEQGEEHQFLPSIVSKVEKMCKSIHQITYEVIFNPISSYINKAQSSWTQNPQRSNLPDYSFTPQEYITQIGEYLLTLPQHLEPFLLNENPSLSKALECADSEYKTETGGGPANILLGMLARGTCQALCDRILATQKLSAVACKQLITDIDYLNNVLEELGVDLTETLQQILTLLRLEPAEYHQQSIGCSHKLVASIREMRSLV